VTALYLAFGFLLFAGIAGGIYWSIRSYRIYKMNLLVSKELDKIIDSTLKTVQRKKSALNQATSSEEGVPSFLDSPDLMSTIITVLVNKFGTVRLSMKDFMIADEEYVSVYVDTGTQEIVLSLDHSLVVDEMYTGFINPADTTFH